MGPLRVSYNIKRKLGIQSLVVMHCPHRHHESADF